MENPVSNHPNRGKRPDGIPSRPTPAAIRAARERVGWTPAQAANAIGCTIAAWTRWEEGEREMQEGLWELFKRRVLEKRTVSFKLGTPERPIYKIKTETREVVVIGHGWQLSRVEEGERFVEVTLATSGAVGITGMRVQRIGTTTVTVPIAGDWFSSGPDAAAWVEKQNDELYRRAWNLALVKHPPLGHRPRVVVQRRPLHNVYHGPHVDVLQPMIEQLVCAHDCTVTFSERADRAGLFVEVEKPNGNMVASGWRPVDDRPNEFVFQREFTIESDDEIIRHITDMVCAP
jgi:hypothetical protein